MCGTSSTFAKVALGLLFLALIFHVVGIATNFWMQTETTIDLIESNIGLWRASNCSDGISDCSSGSVPSYYTDSAFKATQALECIVLVLMLVPVILCMMYVCMDRFRDMSVAVFIVAMCFITVTFAIISMIVWLAQIPENHYASFSFGFCVVAFVMMFLAGILLIPDIRKYNGRRTGRRQDPIKVAPKTPDYSYNRRYMSPNKTPVRKYDEGNTRHYYNPNRESYMKETPPPAYRTLPNSNDRGSKVRTEIMDPDIYLGRSHRRY